MSRSLPHTSLASPSAPACPWESCKVSCQESQTLQTQTSRVPGSRAFHSWLGAKKAKVDVKASQDTTCRDFWVGQALESSSSIWSICHLEHLQHLSPSRTKCPDLAGRQTSGGEPLFCFLLPKITFQSHFTSEHPELLHPSISHGRVAGRPP